jgi:DNA-binding MarR family transcriptional regulator
MRHRVPYFPDVFITLVSSCHSCEGGNPIFLQLEYLGNKPKELDKKTIGVYTRIMRDNLYEELVQKGIEKCVDCACFNLRKASRAVTQVFDKSMQPSRLRATQFSVLAVLASVGPSTITHLSQFLVMDRTTLARNLRPLERKRLISITKGKDRRTKTVILTKRGGKALGGSLAQWQKAQDMVVEKLGEERWKSLLETLSLLPSLFAPESGDTPSSEEDIR